jgi:hypothetical protein
MDGNIMPKIKRIVSEEVHSEKPKTVQQIQSEAMKIDLEKEIQAPKKSSSEDMRWLQVGRPLFGNALDEIRRSLPITPHAKNTKN